MDATMFAPQLEYLADRYRAIAYNSRVLVGQTLMDATMFAPQLEYLADRYRAIAYNSRVLVGQNIVHTLDDLAEDCRALLDHMKIETCVLVGMSVGGFMATAFALKYQRRLDGLVLIGAPSVAFSAEDQEAFRAKFSELDVEGMVPRDFAEWVAPHCFGETTRVRNKALVDHWIERWTTAIPARAVYHQGLSWIAKSDVTERLREITVPTLFVHAEEDFQNPIENVLPMLEKLPNATIVRVPEAGHSSNLENPNVVNDAVGKFLETIYP